MSKGMTAKDRALKIELARVRAALERQSLVRGAHDLRADLRPAALLRGVLPASGGGASLTHWIGQAWSLTRRYPFITSGVTALLSGRGKRRRLFRIAAGLLLSWGVAKASKESARKTSGPAQGIGPYGR